MLLVDFSLQEFGLMTPVFSVTDHKYPDCTPVSPTITQNLNSVSNVQSTFHFPEHQPFWPLIWSLTVISENHGHLPNAVYFIFSLVQLLSKVLLLDIKEIQWHEIVTSIPLKKQQRHTFDKEKESGSAEVCHKPWKQCLWSFSAKQMQSIYQPRHFARCVKTYTLTHPQWRATVLTVLTVKSWVMYKLHWT